MKVNSSIGPTDPKKKIFAKSRGRTKEEVAQVLDEALSSDSNYVFQGGNLEEAPVVAEAVSNPEYPYYTTLTDEQRKFFYDESPIGRAIRHQARTGTRFNNEDVAQFAAGLTLLPLSDVAETVAVPAALAGEAIAQFKGDPYNYSNAIPNYLSFEGTQRFPSQTASEEISWLSKNTGAPEWALGLGLDIVSDPLTWGPLAYAKYANRAAKVGKMFTIGETVMPEAAEALRIPGYADFSQGGKSLVSKGKGLYSKQVPGGKLPYYVNDPDKLSVYNSESFIDNYLKPVSESNSIAPTNTDLIPHYTPENGGFVSFKLIDSSTGAVLGDVARMTVEDFKMSDVMSFMKNSGKQLSYSDAQISDKGYYDIYSKILNGFHDLKFNQAKLYKDPKINNSLTFTLTPEHSELFNTAQVQTSTPQQLVTGHGSLSNHSLLSPDSYVHINTPFYKELKTSDWIDASGVHSSYIDPVGKTGNVTLLNSYIKLEKSPNGKNRYAVSIIDGQSDDLIASYKNGPIEVSDSFAKAINPSDEKYARLTYAQILDKSNEVGDVKLPETYKSLFSLVANKRNAEEGYKIAEFIHQEPDDIAAGVRKVKYKGETYTNSKNENSEFARLNNIDPSRETIVKSEDLLAGWNPGMIVEDWFKNSGIDKHRVSKLSQSLMSLYQGTSAPFNSRSPKYDNYVSEKTGESLRKKVMRDFDELISSQEKTKSGTTLYRGFAKSGNIYKLKNSGVEFVDMSRAGWTPGSKESFSGDMIYLHTAPGKSEKISFSQLGPEHVGMEFTMDTFGSFSLAPRTALGFSESGFLSFKDNVERLQSLRSAGRESQWMDYRFSNPGSLLVADIPANQSIFYVPAHSSSSLNDELEVILQRNARFEITDVIGGSSEKALNKSSQSAEAIHAHNKSVEDAKTELAKEFMERHKSSVDRIDKEMKSKYGLTNYKPKEGEFNPKMADAMNRHQNKMDSVNRELQSQAGEFLAPPYAVIKARLVNPRALLPLLFAKKMFSEEEKKKKINATPSKGQEGN